MGVRYRVIVDAADRNRYGTLRRAAVSVFQLIVKFVGAVKIRGRRIRERTVIIDMDHAVVLGHVLYRQQIAIHVIIVGQHIDNDLTVLGDRGLVGHRHRVIIYRCHCNGDGGLVTGESVVIGGSKGKAVRAVVVGIGTVGECSRGGVQIDLSMGRLNGDIEGKLIVIVILVLSGEDTRITLIFLRLHRLVLGHRGIVFLRD